MASSNFPTWAECLEEFAAGMRDGHDRPSEQTAVECALPVSPFLRNSPVSYADFMAGREQKDA